MLIENSLNELRNELTLMGRKAEAIFARSLESLKTDDESRQREILRDVRAMDEQIDALEIAIDNRAMELLVLHDPYALDFRYIYTTVKNIKDLERIGDKAKAIARWTLRLKSAQPERLAEFCEQTAEILGLAIEALVNEDTARAEQVMPLDLQLDNVEKEIIDATEDIALAFIAEAVGRVGSLATNIAENVIFYLRAEDIRHGWRKKMRREQAGEK